MQHHQLRGKLNWIMVQLNCRDVFMSFINLFVHLVSKYSILYCVDMTVIGL